MEISNKQTRRPGGVRGGDSMKKQTGQKRTRVWLMMAMAVVLAATVLSGCGQETGQSAEATGSYETPARPLDTQPCVHAQSRKEAEAPTCTRAGHEKTVCADCGQTVEETVVPATGHKQDSQVVKQAACTGEGEERQVCEVCAEVLGQSVTVPALGHDFRAAGEDKATCETDGARYTKCARCGEVRTEVLPASGHEFRAATCQQPGECTVCGAQQGEAAAHAWTVKYAVGVPECEVCGTKYTFPMEIKSNIPCTLSAGGKRVSVTHMEYEVRARQGAFAEGDGGTLTILIKGIASGACAITKQTKLYAPDGTEIPDKRETHNPTTPTCDGSFEEYFYYDLPECRGTYTFKVSAR